MIQTVNQKRICRLQNNPIKQYVWGSTSKQSLVGRLSQKKQQHKYFAQLWMGVHCHGQSQIRNEQQDKFVKLSQYIKNRNMQPLQFLYKVLSIQKCLSLQVHPNKQQAIKWSKERPQIYGDNNDKPQMFYTLSQFQCFMGYVGQQQYKRLHSMDIFKQIKNGQQAKNPKQMIICILKLSEQDQVQLLKECLNRIQQIHGSRYNKQSKQRNRRIWKFLDDFPDDIGIVVTFFLDYKIIAAGVCYYIQANMPHAYIHGECLEIMKNSDNVCRLGLTPKLKDLQVMDQALGNHFQQILPILPQNNDSGSVKSSLFSKQGLKFLVIHFHHLNHWNFEQVYHIKSSIQVKICLIIKGSFLIFHTTQQSQKKQQCSQGTALLIQPNSQYGVACKQKNEGLICIGWSQF